MIKLLSEHILPVNYWMLRLHVHVLFVEYFPFPITIQNLMKFRLTNTAHNFIFDLSRPQYK